MFVFLQSELPDVFDTIKYMTLYQYIVACHLPRGSKLQWREDMGGGLPKRAGTAHWLEPPTYWATKNTPSRISVLIHALLLILV